MGKRRKTGGGSQKQYSVNKVNEENLHSSLLNPEERGYIYDEVDDFEDDQDRLALSMAKKLMARKETSYEQVLGIDASSSDEASGDSEEKGSDEDNLYMEDDIVDEPEFKIPDERAWGKAKWKYIGTDTTDENIQKKLRSQDEEMAKLEEDAARKLQERMAAELQDLVASDLIPQEEAEEKPKAEVSDTTVEVNLTGLSHANKLQLLQRESPEFLPLLNDLKERCEEVTSSLSLLMEGVGTRHIESTAVFQYITTKYRLTLNYLCVLCIYMLTKCSQRSLGNHPLVSRLAQFRQLFQELAPCDAALGTHVKQLIPAIISAKSSELNAALPSMKKKKFENLKLLNKKIVNKVEKKRKLSSLLNDSQMSNEEGNLSEVKEEDERRAEEVSSDEGQAAKESAKVEVNQALDPDEKRAIGYQISKNKGLIPSRKKEQRNPRVKYRNKYKTKLKKRKGQVREVRKELKRYDGEVSGIKSHTIKSVKFK